jgi:periplasmic glucans biosynthesis protein
MRRRELLCGSACAVVMAAWPALGDTATPFDDNTVANLARDLAQKSYQTPDAKLPDEFNGLDYQAYRAIRFNKQDALWHGLGLKFNAEFFHRGFLYKERVDVFEVVDGDATPIRYSPGLFTFGNLKPPTEDLGFAGFRIHYPINRPDYYDEVCAFLGASYFRAVARGQGYGLSARGLAIKTADPTGEEFPLFKKFWLVRPAKGSDALTIHALLDSPSAAAAFRFVVRPGADTIFDVQAAVFPRSDLATAGIAPLTSMFLFDTNDRMRFDDYREAVHDSAGLLLRNGKGEQIWRPLVNPRELQISAFTNESPQGFGLMQSERKLDDYQDLEAHYEKRPSLWIEPGANWGQGIVELVEIPTTREVNDNIVCFWRPKDPLKAKTRFDVTYRMHWCWFQPRPLPLGVVTATRDGLADDQKKRLFVVDFVGGALKRWQQAKPPNIDIGCSKGKIENPVAEPNPDTGGWRLSFQLDQGNEKLIEMHARLMNGEEPLTETWLYRWTT